MFSKLACGAVVAFAFLGLSSTATFAHSTLETQSASVGSTYKGVMRVPHGCEGAPTLKVRIQIPDRGETDAQGRMDP